MTGEDNTRTRAYVGGGPGRRFPLLDQAGRSRSVVPSHNGSGRGPKWRP